MTRKHLIVDCEDFFLEPLSPAVVRVEYRDQVGYFGISKDWDVNIPFAYQTSEPVSYEDGVGSSMTSTTTPDSALNCLTYRLKEAQRKEDSQRINPAARKGMAQWVLHEFLEGLPD